VKSNVKEFRFSLLHVTAKQKIAGTVGDLPRVFNAAKSLSHGLGDCYRRDDNEYEYLWKRKILRNAVGDETLWFSHNG
jgi:hypothetical protein